MSEFIPLSVPNFGPREAELASEAITSGWVSTSGGKVTEFEEALANYVGMPRANDSRNIAHVAAYIGTIWDVDAQAVLDQTAENARRCFGL